MKAPQPVLDERSGIGPGPSSSHTIHRIASEEVSGQRRLDLGTTIAAMASTAEEMDKKYGESSEGRPACLGGTTRGDKARPADSSRRWR